MKFILGKKLEMTQKFKDDGKVVPVTAVLAGPCTVTQVRTEDKDGYSAVQVGFGFKKKLNKPEKGHLKDLDNFRYLKEFRLDKIKNEEKLKLGDKIDVNIFEIGDVVKVSGTSKGKGFQGVVKRHKFAGSPASHGHKDQLRMPGSIGATGPARVFKNTRMPGRMGGERVSVKNLEIIDIDKDKNILFIKGAIPGARNSLVEIIG
jgi:large subunit ribosomal protein L3